MSSTAGNASSQKVALVRSLTPRLTRRRKIVLGTVSLAGATAAGTATYYLSLTFDDWREIFGMDAEIFTKDEEEELVALEKEGPPMKAPPIISAHPFKTTKSFLWRLLFCISRFLYIVRLILPVATYGAYWRLIRSDCEEVRRRFFAKCVSALESSGCTMLKFGQWISMRPDMFPKELVELCGRLRESAPAHAFEHTKAAIETAFGLAIEDIFETIDETPVASGCVGQVHRARLRPEYALANGARDVAVKVRHPSVLKETYIDFDILFGVLVPTLNFVWRLTGNTQVHLPFVKTNFYELVMKQIDFKWEAYNLSQFSRNFKREIRQANYARLSGSHGANSARDRQTKDEAHLSTTVSFPRVSPKLLSEAVLVESWAEGVSVGEIYDSEPNTDLGAMRSRVAAGAFDISMKMYLRDNFIHSDMHAGNMLYDPKLGHITVIDAGMATSLPQHILDVFGDFLRAVVLADADVLADAVYQFHDESGSGMPRPEKERLRSEIQLVLDRWRPHGYPPRPGVHSDCTIGDVMADVFGNLAENGVVLRSDVSVALASMQISEGLIIGLDREFDIISNTLPYFVRYQGWGSMQNVLSAGYNGSTDTTKSAHSGNLVGLVDTSGVVVHVPEEAEEAAKAG